MKSSPLAQTAGETDLHERRNRAHAVRLDAMGLIRAKRPALIYNERDDLRHFVIFYGVTGDQVLLRDPAVGNRRIFVEQLVKIWKGGTALFLTKHGALPAPLANGSPARR